LRFVFCSNVPTFVQNTLYMPWTEPLERFMRSLSPLPTGMRWILIAGILGATGCAKLPVYEPIEVHLRANPPLEPEIFNQGTWSLEGQTLAFSLREYHFWDDGGASKNFTDELVRSQEMQYRLELKNNTSADNVEVRVDLVHYGDTVWSGIHLLRDSTVGTPWYQDTNANKVVRFIWN